MLLDAYAQPLADTLNRPASLTRLLEPFGIPLEGTGEDESLLMGHVLDELYQEHRGESLIDPMDVASAAWGLGLDAAGRFLDEGPWILHRLHFDF